MSDLTELDVHRCPVNIVFHLGILVDLTLGLDVPADIPPVHDLGILGPDKELQAAL